MSDERRIDPATGREPDDPRHSNDELAGDMGVSSEREGPTGPGQHGTDGVRYTGATDTPGDAAEVGLPQPAPALGREALRARSLTAAA